MISKIELEASKRLEKSCAARITHRKSTCRDGDGRWNHTAEHVMQGDIILLAYSLVESMKRFSFRKLFLQKAINLLHLRHGLEFRSARMSAI